MFADPSSGQSTCASPSGYHSMRSSFSSDTSSSWEMIETPNSTPRASSEYVKVDGEYLSSSGSFYTPDRYGSGSDFSSTSMNEEIFHAPIAFPDKAKPADQHHFSFGSFPGYNGRLNDFIGCNGLPSSTPSLEMDLCSPHSGSEASPTETDFVIPSQTTFIDAFDAQSHVRTANSMHFDLQYDSPCSDFGSDYQLGGSPMSNMAGSMTYFVPPVYKEPRSASTTPSRPSCLSRQPLFGEALTSSLALHRVQSLPSPPRIQNHNSSRQSRRKKSRDSKREYVLHDNNIPIQKGAAFPCDYIGCAKKFQRKEHLRRHQRTHYKNDNFPCPFCYKPFNRSDNLKQHVTIHTKPKGKASRTDYFEGAAAYLLELESKIKTRKSRAVVYDG